MSKAGTYLKCVVRSKWGKEAFCHKLKGKKARVLDVGCGNGSPMLTKMLAPDCCYVGIDVANYNNPDAVLDYADEYKLFTPEGFAEGIAGLEEEFDAVISSHNIEHCNRPKETLAAMCDKLKKGGMMYMAFPSEASADFPHRNKTLNFYDDPTHIYLPEFDDVLQSLKENGMEIVFSSKEYKPPVFHFWGGYWNRTAGAGVRPCSVVAVHGRIGDLRQ